jgi:uncharacterized membrane protein
MVKETLKGALIASAIATLLGAGAANADDKAAGHAKEKGKGVKCSGVNECKGKGACAGAGSSCAGSNACKGKGWIKMESEKACKDKGGTVVAEKK